MRITYVIRRGEDEMEGITKQQTGFKFGKYSVEVINQIAHYPYNGRVYKLLRVRTSDGLEYISLRLYNSSGRFIKQMMVEPQIAGQIFKECV